MPGKVTAKCVQPVQLFPGFLFFCAIVRQVYQVIKAGTYPLHLVFQRKAGWSFHHIEERRPTRTHLNRKLIEYPDGIKDRSAAVQRRLEEAGLTRKIDSNQVRVIRITCREHTRI